MTVFPQWGTADCEIKGPPVSGTTGTVKVAVVSVLRQGTADCEIKGPSCFWNHRSCQGICCFSPAEGHYRLKLKASPVSGTIGTVKVAVVSVLREGTADCEIKGPSCFWNHRNCQGSCCFNPAGGHCRL
ncbi:hypothetical protein ACOMHN_053338 [Nucella lapillus]